MSPLVLVEILGVFANTLTSEVKYPIQGCENLEVPIEMQLCEKRKSSSEVFIALLVNSLKSTVLEQALVVNMWKHHDCFLNLNESPLITFFYHSQGSVFGKCLP